MVLKSDLKEQGRAYADLRATEARSGGESSAAASSSAVIAEKVGRIHELEDEILELQNSLSQVSRQLAAAKSEGTSKNHSFKMKQKELDDYRLVLRPALDTI